MSAFVVAAALLALLVLAYVLRPLFRPAAHAPGGSISNDEANLAVYRGMLNELDADLAAGKLDADSYDSARLEIERRLLEDVSGAATPAPRSRRKAAAALGFAVPACAIALYVAVGTPQALTGDIADSVMSGASRGSSDERLASLVEQLAERLKAAPDDAEGWIMLGRSYAALGRFADASQAYTTAARLLPDDAALLVDHADVLGMAQNGRLEGEPARLVAQALRIDPQNVKALALSGTAAFQRQDYAGAVRQWERILPLVPGDGKFVDSVRESISEARGLGGLGPAAAQSDSTRSDPKRSATASRAPARVSGIAVLSRELAAKASPDDAVFIFARAVDGPRVPLAVLRRKVSDLPVAFTLDDSLAMAPDMKLSAFKRVVIGARISKAATAAPRPGDLEGLSSAVDVGAERVSVVIDTVVR